MDIDDFGPITGAEKELYSSRIKPEKKEILGFYIKRKKFPEYVAGWSGDKDSPRWTNQKYLALSVPTARLCEWLLLLNKKEAGISAGVFKPKL